MIHVVPRRMGENVVLPQCGEWIKNDCSTSTITIECADTPASLSAWEYRQDAMRDCATPWVGHVQAEERR